MVKRHLSPMDYSAFYRHVAERDLTCVLCSQYPEERDVCRDRSGGIFDAHHVIPQRVLKRELAMHDRVPALSDERNGVLLGRWHHSMAEARMRDLLVPGSVWEFARDYGLEWFLERGEMAA